MRFVVIPDHSSYGLIQHSLAGGAPIVTPRRVSHNGNPRPPFSLIKKDNSKKKNQRNKDERILKMVEQEKKKERKIRIGLM